MLSIFATTDFFSRIQAFIAKEDRLDELIELKDLLKERPMADGHTLLVKEQGMFQPIDWHNTRPPYLLCRPMPLEESYFLALIFHKLGNDERAWEIAQQQSAFQQELSLMIRLQHGLEIKQGEVKQEKLSEGFEGYRSEHNRAILMHYGFLEPEVEYADLQAAYLAALELAPNDEYRAFTSKHFATLLLDRGEVAAAEVLLQEGLERAISEDAKYEMKALISKLWMQQLSVPYDTNLLEKLKALLWETLQYYEKEERNAEAGLLLLDATRVANISESFTEALGYVSKAIRLLDDEGLFELAGQAHMQKGTLLYTWAQKGNPQFYKSAVESYQSALKVFKKELAPAVFAEIHHQLAVLYAEMPAEPKKKSIWAGVAVSSFQEALSYYTKESFPYVYAMICNNYGNALTKFPPAVHSDNHEKALYYYQEALSVRTADYPYERAISLLNYLEASWNVSNATEEFNALRYSDMLQKAEEVSVLVEDEKMREEAEKHLLLLADLKKLV